ncbi:hypothetical protein FACS1894113_4920 [Alphaproteobacteria bacterium]|nr:hypothetical protein FACS1894113_4920 [Alphaproteobacteria bacterium]
MVVAAPICAFIAKKTASSLLAFMSCYIIVHVFGCVWLANFVGWKSVFVLGVVPFVISEILKISLVCAMKPGISRLLKKI